MTPPIRLLAIAATLSLLLTAGTAFAHLLEMPHKLAMDYAPWFAVQATLYDGWGRVLGVLLAVEIVGFVLVAIAYRPARSGVVMVFVCIALAEGVVFLAFIAPTNAAVEGWQAAGRAGMLDGWQALRANWEYGHAARFVLLTLGGNAALHTLTRTTR